MCHWPSVFTRSILLVLLISGIFVASCTEAYKKHGVYGNDFVRIPDQYIYIIDASNHSVIDSTEIRNGNFRFDIPKDSNPQKKVSLKFKLNGKDDLVGFPTSKGYYTTFFIEKEVTTLAPHTRKDNFKNDISAEVINGYENSILYQNPDLMIPPNAKPEIYFKRFQQLINRYPESEYIADCLYSLRNYFELEHYTELYKEFNPQVRNGHYGRLIADFINSINKTNNLVLQDSLFKNHTNVHHKEKLNMIVFWATWCAPCRKEIPQVKYIYEKYKNKDFSVISISTDSDSTVWSKFVKDNKDMTWPQYRIPNNYDDIVSYKFSLTALPLIVFTNEKGKIIHKYKEGYSDDNVEKLSAFIENYFLKRKH